MKTSNKDWEKEFDSKWHYHMGGFYDVVKCQFDDLLIKIFIRSLLLQHNKEIIEKIKGNIKVLEDMGEGYVSDEYNAIDALKNILSLLEESGGKE